MDEVKLGGDKVGIDDDGGDGMQCSEHPFRNNPGGICAVCLQERLGKLVSSSFPLPLRGSSSSSTSPSFRSEGGSGSKVVSVSNVGSMSGGSLSLAVRPSSVRVRADGDYSRQCEEYHSRRVRIPFMLARRGKKMAAAESSSSLDRINIVFKRSKSTSTTPGKRGSHFLGTTKRTAANSFQDYSPRRRGFWSFFHLSSSKSKVEKTTISATTVNGTSQVTKSSLGIQKDLCSSTLSGRTRRDLTSMPEEDGADDTASPRSLASASGSSFERKVSRSRSVGCGSRSFSGDFFERISTGFGDCTLRRVESQREGKPKSSTGGANIKERVRCGGIFGGFIIAATPSSYWVSSSADEISGKPAAVPLPHGRMRNWGWAFASPMRAFTKPASTKDGRADHKNGTPDLSAVPSILAVRT